MRRQLCCAVAFDANTLHNTLSGLSTVPYFTHWAFKSQDSWMCLPCRMRCDIRTKR